MPNPWFGRSEPAQGAAFRLFCLPYAGGSAAAYRDWHALAPHDIQICPLELPGRGSRILEPPLTRLPQLSGALAEALAPHLDRPFAVFGHSMGGLLAFELTRTLRRCRRPLPAHLFVSAVAGPDAPRTRPPVHRASDADVVDELRALGGTPRELLEDEELMRLMLPTIRADFSALETYRYRPEPPLPVPLTVLGGTDDPLVPVPGLEGWHRQTDVDAAVRLLPGGHFFLHSAAAGVMAVIAETFGIPAPVTRCL
ncbi:thioesterase II family protein [Streptomyces sp. CMB-StM0423]|uniref:thioesterase II family protein n=1 Tax=Streptomyces sp. CMB-StM0423 TaxID=2059884 RepID=UPI000C7012F1|nr:alpha/beta fold hydrolase [Streptomyces sp. CMB-StM0423]AUH38862.1 putative thioesterase [Streptomyces sp. CMB-StM0423]